MPMHRTRLVEKLMRVVATDGKQTWIYQFPEGLWTTAVRRVMEDIKAKKLPDSAGGGLLEMIAEGVADGD